MNERLEAIISGRVQMVMYRDFASRKARALRLTGEVKNLKDGTVQVVAEGSRARLEQFVMQLSRGSFLSKVKNTEITFLPARGDFSDFKIFYE